MPGHLFLVHLPQMEERTFGEYDGSRRFCVASRYPLEIILYFSGGIRYNAIGNITLPKQGAVID